MTINCSPWTKSTRPEVFTTQQDLRSLQLSCKYIYIELEWNLLECLMVYGSVMVYGCLAKEISRIHYLFRPWGWMSQLVFRVCWNQVDNKTSCYIDHLVISGFSKQRNKQTKNPHTKSKPNKQTNLQTNKIQRG